MPCCSLNLWSVFRSERKVALRMFHAWTVGLRGGERVQSIGAGIVIAAEAERSRWTARRRGGAKHLPAVLSVIPDCAAAPPPPPPPPQHPRSVPVQHWVPQWLMITKCCGSRSQRTQPARLMLTAGCNCNQPSDAPSSDALAPLTVKPLQSEIVEKNSANVFPYKGSDLRRD